MSNDQEQDLRILDNALWRIAHRGDCEYDYEEDRPKPCDCPRCVAIAALESAKNWRFHGALYERTQGGNWPRETKMHAAWMKIHRSNRGAYDPDQLLSQILKEDHAPSARDWYVATSVVQWLATNVGMAVLEEAGFKYQQWTEDCSDLDQRRRTESESESESESEKPRGSP